MKPPQLIGLVVVVLAVGVVIALKSSKAPENELATTPAAVHANLPRLLDLGSTTCAACKKMDPIIRQLKVELQDKVNVEFIDIATKVEAADQYQIQVIPTQIFFDAAGKEVLRHEGFMPKADILAQLAKMGVAVN